MTSNRLRTTLAFLTTAALVGASAARAEIFDVEGRMQTQTGPYQYTRTYRFTLTTPTSLECLRNDGADQPA